VVGGSNGQCFSAGLDTMQPGLQFPRGISSTTSIDILPILMGAGGQSEKGLLGLEALPCKCEPLNSKVPPKKGRGWGGGEGTAG
jgi:hypothetical protein